MEDLIIEHKNAWHVKLEQFYYFVPTKYVVHNPDFLVFQYVMNWYMKYFNQLW